jgi:RimJ/RimL family protein N-acetyltransferase
MRIVLPGDPLVDASTALRPWRETDLDGLVAACQDPEIPRWTRVPAHYGRSDARAFLMHRHDAIHAGEMAPFAIVSSDDLDHLLGSVAIIRIAERHARGEVGYWLGREARGGGHATRAVRLICDWAFAALKLDRIDLIAATGNPASQNVAERAGFTREAVLRSFLQGKGERFDMVMFGLLRPST